MKEEISPQVTSLTTSLKVLFVPSQTATPKNSCLILKGAEVHYSKGSIYSLRGLVEFVKWHFFFFKSICSSLREAKNCYCLAYQLTIMAALLVARNGSSPRTLRNINPWWKNIKIHQRNVFLLIPPPQVPSGSMHQGQRWARLVPGWQCLKSAG